MTESKVFVVYEEGFSFSFVGESAVRYTSLVAVFETLDGAEKFISQREVSSDVSYYIDEATMYHE